jgi:hypothetical protein
VKALFTDLFRMEAKELKLGDDCALAVLNNCDKMQEVSYEGLLFRLFIKKESGDSHTLILSQVELDQLKLLLPFRIRADLFRHIEVLEPLRVLELFAQNYGLVISIGPRLGRFLYQERIKVQYSQTQIVSMRNPDDHDFLQSIFVKLEDTPSGRVAVCALAFCIDKHLYRRWLSSGLEEKTHEIQPLPVARIIGQDTVKKIIEFNSTEPEPGKRSNLTELDLALVTIKTVMGHEWYDTVLKEYPDTTTQRYKNFVRSTAVHPLSQALWSGQPEDYIRVIQLGIYLNQLWRNDNSNRLLDKIKELRQYSFHHTYYELKIAAHFDQRMSNISFIPRETGLKTPDFRIDSTDGFAFAECKRRDSESLQIDSDVDEAALQLEEYGGPGIIFIELLKEVDDQTAHKMLDRGKELLQGTKNVSLLFLTHEVFLDEMGTLALSGRVRGIRINETSARLPPNIEKVAHFDAHISWMPLSQT